jgi:HK97 family phage major capsid protein
MDEKELEALVNQRVDAVVQAAAKAEGESVTQTPAPVSGEVTATFTQDQVNELIAADRAKTIDAAAKAFEAKFIAARRPPFQVNVARPKGTAMPLTWAVKAARSNFSGRIILRDTADGIAFRANDSEGDESAVKAFVKFAQAANVDVDAQNGILYGVKAMSTVAGAAVGEHFIDRSNERPVIEALYQAVVSRKLPGVEIYPMPSQICDAPTIGAFTAGWTAENAATTSAGDATTGRKTLTAKKLTAYAEISNELIADSNPAAEPYVRNGLAMAMGEAHDVGAFAGTGASNQPVGLTVEAGVTNTAFATDFFTSVYAALGRMLANKIPSSQICVIANPKALMRAAWQRAGTNGDFLTAAAPLGSPLGGEPLFSGLSNRLGLPVFSTTALAETGASPNLVSKVLVLHAPSWTIGDRQELEIASSNVAGNSFRNDQTYVRAIMRVDFNLKRAAGLEIITGVPHE